MKLHAPLLRASALAFLVSLPTVPLTASAAPGDADITFNNTGFLRPGFGPAPNVGRGVAAQADGRIVVAGACFNGDSWDFSVLRYNSDGSPDLTFGTNGQVITGFAPGSYDIAKCVAVQGDGKIVVGGDSGARFALARYNSDGTLDASFDGDGLALAGEAGLCEGNGLTLQPDGALVLVGSRVTDVSHFAAVRFLSNGVPDLAFGGDGTGIATTPLLTRDVANGVALQSDLKIVAVGTTVDEVGNNHLVVVRYNTNGSLDNSFHLDGSTIASIGFQSEGFGIAVQTSLTDPDKVVATGVAEMSGGFDVALLRFNYDGTPDVTFDGDGVVTTDFNLDYDAGRAVSISYSGATPSRIIVGGIAGTFSDFDYGVARYFVNGSLDGAFDGDGRATTHVGPGDEPYGMTRVSGKIVLVGATGQPDQDCAVVRYNDNGTLDSTFDGDGIRVDDAGFRSANARGVAIQADGKILAAGTVFFPDIPNFAVFRCHPDGTPDSSWNGTGFVETDYLGADEQGAAVAQASDGKILVAGTRISEPPDSAIMVVRYNTDGMPDASFGDNGVMTHIPEGLATVVEDMLIQPDGHLLVAGWTASSQVPFPFMVLTRYDPDGSPDPTFGNFGLVTLAFGSGAWAKAIALRPDGGILVTGYTRQGSFDEFVTVALESDGFLDTSFGGSGWVITSVAGGHDQARDVVLEPGGKILVTGRSDNGVDDDAVIIRYNPDGSLDTSFDSDGIVVTPVNPTYRGANTLLLQPNGRIVIAGQQIVTTRFDLHLMRYNADGSIDGTYGTGGQARFDVSGGGHDVPLDIVLDDEGRTVLTGLSGGLFVIGRIHGDGPISGVSPGDGIAPSAPLQVGLPFPNPVRRATSIDFRMSGDGEVSAVVVDVAGRKVSTLLDQERLAAGTHRVEWDGRNEKGVAVAGGVYFVRLTQGNTIAVRALTVVRS